METENFLPRVLHKKWEFFFLLNERSRIIFYNTVVDKYEKCVCVCVVFS